MHIREGVNRVEELDRKEPRLGQPWAHRQRPETGQAEQESKQDNCAISSIIPDSIKSDSEKLHKKLHRTTSSRPTPTGWGPSPKNPTKIIRGYVSQHTVIKAFIV
jgi:hypothetical protein